MSKVLDATCKDNKVTFQGVPVDGVLILSKGVAQSSGVLILQEGKAYYVTSSATDLEATLTGLLKALEKLGNALTQTAAALTTLDAKPVGGVGSAPAPAVASQVADINSAISEIQSASQELTDLKGALK